MKSRRTLSGAGGCPVLEELESRCLLSVVIPDVPSYLWYNGCGPTAAGMIVGYWDAHGYDNLIPGSNDWAANTQAIKDMIASPGHIRDYASSPDRVATAEDPYPGGPITR